jgi:hypothetical protein
MVISPIQEVQADSLGDYKEKKHKKRKKIKQKDCVSEYIKRCQSKCTKKEQTCMKQCTRTAAQFCEERKKKRFNQQVGLAAKGTSLAVGAIAVMLDDEMPTVDPNGKLLVNEYTKLWNKPSFNMELGGGLLNSGTMEAHTTIGLRKGSWGFGANIHYLWNSEDYLMEADVGPMFYLPSASFIAGLQPSLLISEGNDVDREYGFGLRAPTRMYIDQFLLIFNPMLGRINSLWNYHLKVSIGYRFHPKFGIFGGYEYRDIVDLNDLDITTASMQGAFLFLRYNHN